jgi:hypothetical protein
MFSLALNNLYIVPSNQSRKLTGYHYLCDYQLLLTNIFFPKKLQQSQITFRYLLVEGKISNQQTHGSGAELC